MISKLDFKEFIQNLKIEDISLVSIIHFRNIKNYYYDDVNDEYYIDNGPHSRIYFNKNGLYNRKNGPAVIWYNKSNNWCFWKNGKSHRDDGPCANYYGNFQFILNHITHDELNFAVKTNHLICNLCNKFCKQTCFF